MHQVIILSEEDDAHIPYVTRHLRNCEVIVLDPSTISKGNELTYWVNKGKVQLTYKGIVLSKVVGFWYRKPQLTARHNLPVPEGYRDYSYDALRHHFLWLENQFPNAIWMSPYYLLAAASNKVLQLKLASDFGFIVPETICTSYPQAAKKFLKKYPATIIKPISTYSFFLKHTDGGERPVFFYATKVNRGEKVDLTNLHLAPTIFQQAIESVVGDLRVNIVGEKVFTSLITNPGLTVKGSIRDWRIGHETGTLKIEQYDKLPKSIEKKCVAYIKAQGLNFGAIDLILDKKGEYWFLENNANGQWAFIEEATKQPIGKEIAHFLLYGKNI